MSVNDRRALPRRIVSAGVDTMLCWRGQTCIVSVIGDVNPSGAQGLWRVLDDQRADGASQLVVDLSDVDVFSSAAVSMLLDAHTSWQKYLALHVVASPDTILRRVLRLADPSRQLAVYSTVEEALFEPVVTGVNELRSEIGRASHYRAGQGDADAGLGR